MSLAQWIAGIRDVPQAEIQAAAAATAEEASQMNESGELDDSYLAGDQGSAMAGGGVAGAGLGATAGAATSNWLDHPFFHDCSPPL